MFLNLGEPHEHSYMDRRNAHVGSGVLHGVLAVQPLALGCGNLCEAASL